MTWENITSAESIVGQEASTLRSIHRERAALPLEVQEEIHDLVQQYAGEVVTEEWPAMADAVPGVPSAWATSSTS